MLNAEDIKRLIPQAVEWVREEESIALSRGAKLTAAQVSDAIAMGVRDPGQVRTLSVSDMPVPKDAELRQAAEEFGLISPTTRGMAMGHGVLVRTDFWTDRLVIAHELVHVGQYERLGGVLPFLQAYVAECDQFGYPNGPLEREAIERSERLVRGV